MTTTYTPPSQRHSPESVAAAAAIKPRAESMQACVLAAIKAAGQAGLTDQEGMVETGFGESYRPRRIRLVELGLVVKAAEKRLTKHGNKAAVWIIRPRVAGTLFSEV